MPSHLQYYMSRIRYTFMSRFNRQSWNLEQFTIGSQFWISIFINSTQLFKQIVIKFQTQFYLLWNFQNSSQKKSNNSIYSQLLTKIKLYLFPRNLTKLLTETTTNIWNSHAWKSKMQPRRNLTKGNSWLYFITYQRLTIWMPTYNRRNAELPNQSSICPILIDLK